MSSRCPIQDPAHRIGEELNSKWTLVHLLGVGGSSAVFEAVHRNGRHVAVKMLADDGKSSMMKRHARRLAMRESLLANAIDHPGVVAVFDNDESEDGSIYLVMELLEGETLERMRSRLGGRIPLETALPLFDALLDVLEAAHARGIVHRDLKPENVFLTKGGQLKILDFGLAMLGRDDADHHERWFGTPGFMAPEQARGAAADIDVTTDLWAVAATFFTALTGQLVHLPAERRRDAAAAAAAAVAPTVPSPVEEGPCARRECGTRQALVDAAASEDVDLSPLEGLVPIEVFDVIERALAFDKHDRWPTSTAMRAALLRAGSAANLKRWRNQCRRIVLPTAPPIPHCRSATRVFRVDGQLGDDITCTICPVCPALPKRATPAVDSRWLRPA